MAIQIGKVFFDYTPDRSRTDLAAPPNESEVRLYLEPNNMNCPLNRVVVSKRNEPAMHQLRTFAYTAMMRYDHSCRGMNFGFYCGPGQGKTHTVRAFADTIGIPLVFVQSDALESTWMLFQLIAAEFKKTGIDLVPTIDDYTYTIPPCLVWFDEAQALSKDLRTGGLLNAMEYNDGWLRTQPDGKNQRQITIDCQHICWIASSTDPGDIYAQSAAFYDRLSAHVMWHPAGPREIALIVKKNSPELPDEAAKLVAHYVRVPRNAISFANQMVMQRNMLGCDWNQAAEKVAEIQGIDQHGMPLKEVNILRILGQRAVSKSNLPNMLGLRPAEVNEILVKSLLNADLILPTHKGYAITKAGLKELDRRGIPHKGQNVSAEYIMGD